MVRELALRWTTLFWGGGVEVVGSPPTCSSFPVRPTTLRCFVCVQVKNGIWSFLDYVEDIVAGRPLRLS